MNDVLVNLSSGKTS